MNNNNQSQQQSTAHTSQRELKVFNNQFVVRKKLSSGSFGVVFQGDDRVSGEMVALKIEKNENEESTSLDRETHILSRLQGVLGVPKLFWSGTEGNYNIMVITLLGRDLAHYIKTLKRFSLKTILLLTDQLLNILEQCHNKSVVHRDLKPENVLISRDLKSVYLVDFGISKIFKDSKGNHIPFRDQKPFIGTTRYAPIAAHKGHELGRADDLESLGYMLVFLYKGILPWQNMQNVSDKDKTKAVGKMKMHIEISELCKDMPEEFAKYFDYVKSLQFKSSPDYKMLIDMFRKCAQDRNIPLDGKYDWIEIETNKKDANEKLSQKESKIRGSRKQIQSGESEKPIKQQKNPDKRTSLVMPELSSQSGQSSQFDFLRPPDPYAKAKQILQRSQERHKSVSSLAPSQYSMANTFQSSLANKYVGSNMVNDFGDEQQSQQSKQSRSRNKSRSLNKSQDEQKQEVKEVKQEVIQSKNFGFQDIRNDTLGFQFDDDEGLFDKYEQLLKVQLQVKFKGVIKKGKQ